MYIVPTTVHPLESLPQPAPCSGSTVQIVLQDSFVYNSTITGTPPANAQQVWGSVASSALISDTAFVLTAMKRQQEHR